ncbi:hypothetical protein ACN27G_22485 [Plantactinospora sp. WMMB334]|uniref:hypothetical protein n=1 Tax=Plantactinospora sp. WMMB334 TaxID=3404119 RepID=UPI003B965D22
MAEMPPGSGPPRIFMSYTHVDRGLATFLGNGIGQYFEVQIGLGAVEAGRPWVERLLDDIRRSDVEGVPVGGSAWREFEDVCVEILKFLFVPPLSEPKIQPRTYSGTERRDAVFPNRNHRRHDNWGILLSELGARLILFEFKNYDRTEIGKDEIIQTSSYLTQPMGRLAAIVGSKKPNPGAHTERNQIFSSSKNVILFLTKEHLVEMLYMKERGEDPSDLIMDEVELFYLQHE